MMWKIGDTIFIILGILLGLAGLGVIIWGIKDYIRTTKRLIAEHRKMEEKAAIAFAGFKEIGLGDTYEEVCQKLGGDEGTLTEAMGNFSEYKWDFGTYVKSTRTTNVNGGIQSTSHGTNRETGRTGNTFSDAVSNFTNNTYSQDNRTFTESIREVREIRVQFEDDKVKGKKQIGFK